MAKKGATGDFFFHFCKKKKKNKIWGKKIASARLASILATRCTGNRIFFMDSLMHLYHKAGFRREGHYIRIDATLIKSLINLVL